MNLIMEKFENFERFKEKVGNMVDTSPLNGIYDAGKEYIDLKVDEIKLKTVEGLSVGMARFLSLTLLTAVLIITLILVSFALILLFGKMISNYALAAVIVASVYIVLSIILFSRRKKMFVDGFVRMFSSIFFDDEKDK